MHQLELETIGSCNRVCGTCLRQSTPFKTLPIHTNRFPVANKIGKGMKMPMDMIKDIIQQAKEIPDLQIIMLSHFNEPFLDDRLPEIGRYVREQIPNIDLRTCTNFDLMTKELAEEVDGLFNRFNISLYYEDPTYSKRKKKIQSWFNKSILNIHAAGKAEDYHMTTHFSPREERLKEKINSVKNKPCMRYNNMCIIAYDGTFLHCCEDYNGNFNLGNVKDKTIMEMWNSETHRKLMHDLSFMGGRKLYKYCENCPDKG